MKFKKGNKVKIKVGRLMSSYRWLADKELTYIGKYKRGATTYAILKTQGGSRIDVNIKNVERR